MLHFLTAPSVVRPQPLPDSWSVDTVLRTLTPTATLTMDPNSYPIPDPDPNPNPNPNPNPDPTPNQADLLPTLAMPSDHHPVVTDLGYSRAHCAKLREGRLGAREAHGEERRREVRRRMLATKPACGYRLHGTRLQVPSHTVAVSAAYGCWLHCIRLQHSSHVVAGGAARGGQAAAQRAARCQHQGQ